MLDERKMQSIEHDINAMAKQFALRILKFTIFYGATSAISNVRLAFRILFLFSRSSMSRAASKEV
jgi:hypothetical protein